MANIIEKAKARLAEKRGSDYTLYHKSYTDAINHALSYHEKSGLHVSDDDRFQHVGVGSKKPSEGNTTSVNIPATHTSGKKHMIHVQVFNKGGTHPYELNTYSSGMGRHVKEEDTSWYPKEGFPKEGEYGYHPNPGLKPQESDKDEDMDKAYKAATEAEAPKPLNAKKLEVTNKVEEETLMERGEDDKGYYRSTEDGAGLTRKGAKAMGVKTAVTTPPSKLDPNGKAAKRRKSFCARMGGMKGPMKDEKGRPTRKAMSLRRWNCRTEETQLDEVLGTDNEWGRPELRKKFAAMTPGQEGLAADQIPVMDPFSGNAIHEEQLDEISALGAKKRSQFAAKLQKRLADPKSIAKAKKEVAKKKAAEKAQAAEAPKHLVMQLRKASSIGAKVKFHDGSEHHVAPNHVEKFNDRYHSLKSSIEKESLVKRAHKSHADFMRAISEELEMGQTEAPCTCNISPANYPHPSQLSPEPMLGDMNNDNEINKWDEAAIEADVTNEIENSNWQDLSKYYDEEDEDEDETEDLDEAITPQGRLKKKFAAMRNKTRRNMAKNIALKRIASPDRIKARSIRAARRMVYKRILRNRDPSTVSAAEKARLEDQVKRMAPMVSRLSIRLQQAERKRDQQRVANARTRKK